MRALQAQHAAEAGLRKIDIVNAFNEFDRHQVLELIADKRQYLSQVAAWGAAQVAELQALLPVVWAMLSVAPELVGEGGACIAAAQRPARPREVALAAKARWAAAA